LDDVPKARDLRTRPCGAATERGNERAKPGDAQRQARHGREEELPFQRSPPVCAARLALGQGGSTFGGICRYSNSANRSQQTSVLKVSAFSGEDFCPARAKSDEIGLVRVGRAVGGPFALAAYSYLVWRSAPDGTIALLSRPAEEDG
jgi:hypothetical protein